MRIDLLSAIPPELYSAASHLTDFGIYHSQRWHTFLSRVFGWKVMAITARTGDGHLVWFLPFVLKRRAGLRKRNIALPMSHKMGPASAAEAAGAGDELAEMLRDRLGNLEVHDDCSALGLTRYTNSSITTLDLKPYGKSGDLLKTLDYKSVRYPINRGMREGINVVEAISDAHYADLYALTVETRHRQGAPVYPKNFFTALRDTFAETRQINALLGYHQGRAVSAVVFLYNGDSALYGYSASTSDPAAKRLGGNDLVMWRAIENALERGCTLLDFGSSPDTLPGLRAFKEKWGGRTDALWYSALDTFSSDRALARTSPIVHMGTAVFRRLPRPLFRVLTPAVFRLVV